MSIRTPTAPRSVFRDISDRLEAPLPQRTRFLRELSSDLDLLTRSFVAEGHSPEEARRRAAAALVPDPATLAHLGRIHASWYRRVTGRLSARLLMRIERATLGGRRVDRDRSAGATAAGPLRGPLPVPPAGARGRHAHRGGRRRQGVRALGEARPPAPAPRPRRDPRARRRAARARVLGRAFRHGRASNAARVLTRAGRRTRLTRRWRERPPSSRPPSSFALVGALGWFVASHWIAFVEHAHERAIQLDDSLAPSNPFPRRGDT